MSGLAFWVSGLVFGCLDLYLGVWTCIWVSGLVFWVSGLVFWCLDLYFGAWTCTLGVCILVGCDYGVRARGPGPGDPDPGTRGPDI